jgi:hypothetical protein
MHFFAKLPKLAQKHRRTFAVCSFVIWSGIFFAFFAKSHFFQDRFLAQKVSWAASMFLCCLLHPQTDYLLPH